MTLLALYLSLCYCSCMSPQPQSRASLEALNENLRQEALARGNAYAGMQERVEHSRRFDEVMATSLRILQFRNAPPELRDSVLEIRRMPTPVEMPTIHIYPACERIEV